jgi:hypothetical protein
LIAADLRTETFAETTAAPSGQLTTIVQQQRAIQMTSHEVRVLLGHSSLQPTLADLKAVADGTIECSGIQTLLIVSNARER